MGDDEKPDLPVKIGASANLDVKTEIPPEVTGEAIQAVLTALSPFTEGMGIVGVHLRVHRERVLLKIAKIVRERAEIEGIELGPVPPKFLIPFIEKASCEDLESELLEMWANLLAQASTEYDSSLITFCDIISSLGKREAEALKTIAQGMKRIPSLEAHNPIAIHRESFLRQLEPNFVHLLDAPGASEYGKILDEIQNISEQTIGIEVLFCIMPQSPNGTSPIPLFEEVPDQAYLHSGFHLDFPLSTDILQRENLVAIREARYYSNFDQNKFNPFTIGYAELTNLGLGFVDICDPPED